MKRLACALILNSALLQAVSLPTQLKHTDVRKINDLFKILDVEKMDQAIKKTKKLVKKSENLELFLTQGLGVKSLQEGMSKLEKIGKQERKDAKRIARLEDEIAQLAYEKEMLEEKNEILKHQYSESMNMQKMQQQKIKEQPKPEMYQEVVHEIIEEDEPIKIPPPPRKKKTRKRTTIRPMKRLATE